MKNRIAIRQLLGHSGWLSYSIGCLAVVVVWLADAGATMAFAPQNDGQQPADTVRFKEVSDSLNQLKKLRSDLGAGHPRVQEIIRNLKLIEEDLRLEQSFTERLAAQVKAAEDELRERQKLDWEKSQSIHSAISARSEDQIPSLETIELLERQALTELQRIDWEIASAGTEAKPKDLSASFQADELRVKALQLTRDLAKLILDSTRERQGKAPASPATAAQEKTAVQVASLELSIAEANLQAAEIDLALKKQLAKELPQSKLDGLKNRRMVVEQQLKNLPSKKEMSKQLAQIQQNGDLITQQIRELETQRFQHQSKSAEQQSLLEIVRQALSPQAPQRSTPKSIN